MEGGVVVRWHTGLGWSERETRVWRRLVVLVHFLRAEDLMLFWSFCGEYWGLLARQVHLRLQDEVSFVRLQILYG